MSSKGTASAIPEGCKLKDLLPAPCKPFPAKTGARAMSSLTLSGYLSKLPNRNPIFEMRDDK